jgi:hypothetical protein
VLGLHINDESFQDHHNIEIDLRASLRGSKPGNTHNPGMSGVSRDATGGSGISSKSESNDDSEESLMMSCPVRQSSSQELELFFVRAIESAIIKG